MVDEVRGTCRAIGCVVVSGVGGLRRGLHGWCVLGQGICRKPLQCKERHKALTERVGSEGLENTEDPSSSQPQASKVSAAHPGVVGSELMFRVGAWSERSAGAGWVCGWGRACRAAGWMG